MELRYEPLGYEQLASIGSATPLSAIPASADTVLLQAEGQNVRFTDDPANPPTATTGMLLLTGQPPFQYKGDLAALQFIQASATGKVNATFYKTAG